MKKTAKTTKKQVKKAKPGKRIIPNNDFLQSGAQNFYLTDNSIVTQRVVSIDKTGKPIAVKNEYYKRTKEREAAMNAANVKPGSPIVAKAASRKTTFWR